MPRKLIQMEKAKKKKKNRIRFKSSLKIVEK